MRTRSLKTAACLLTVCLALSSCMDKETFGRENNLIDFFLKREVTIAVLDSGLGGLSILAEAAEKMKDTKIFHRVHFLFFNALFSKEGGYNGLKTQQEKVLIFDSALRSLEGNFSPDLILIGCNTLSALYEKTRFSQETSLPVVGIIESGVDLIAENLKTQPEAQVILFATHTTIEEGVHKKGLVDSGFLPERIITQTCPDLIQYIEKGTTSDETEMLIFAYADEALQKIKNPETPLFVSFNCTHYGYSLALWEKAFLSLGKTPEAFLNPNSRMINFLTRPDLQNRVKNSTVSVSMVSMVKIGQEERASIGQQLARISPQTAEALYNYELRENLFLWKEFVAPQREVRF